MDKSVLFLHCRSDSGSGLPLTGDAKADADIMAFVKARQNILRQGRSS